MFAWIWACPFGLVYLLLYTSAQPAGRQCVWRCGRDKGLYLLQGKQCCCSICILIYKTISYRTCILRDCSWWPSGSKPGLLHAKPTLSPLSYVSSLPQCRWYYSLLTAPVFGKGFAHAEPDLAGLDKKKRFRSGFSIFLWKKKQRQNFPSWRKTQ